MTWWARRLTIKGGGGLVGYLGYETIRQFEPHLKSLPAAGDLPEGIFLLTDTLVAFDHARRSLFLIAHAFGGDQAAAQRRLDELEQRLARSRYLVGDSLTEADWRLFTTLVRFDAVYVGHFKCNLKREAT